MYTHVLTCARVHDERSTTHILKCMKFCAGGFCSLFFTHRNASALEPCWYGSCLSVCLSGVKDEDMIFMMECLGYVISRHICTVDFSYAFVLFLFMQSHTDSLSMDINMPISFFLDVNALC
jgi:hypothetical protein